MICLGDKYKSNNVLWAYDNQLVVLAIFSYRDFSDPDTG